MFKSILSQSRLRRGCFADMYTFIFSCLLPKGKVSQISMKVVYETRWLVMSKRFISITTQVPKSQHLSFHTPQNPDSCKAVALTAKDIISQPSVNS